jgi:hypothetical protein
MSRRPDDISPNSTLVFQEGKLIEEEAYIISVYEDPSLCRLTFVAYELESDKVYHLTYSYAQMDEIFQFNSELVNPNNRDGRYHWIIERLDFVLVDLRDDVKTLTLSLEKTPETAAPKPKPKVKGELTSQLDAELRAKLVHELQTYDTTALQHELVKSEGARHTFLRELFAKRRIEQLKALQRQVKVDEDREERRAKLMSNKVLLEEKALKFKQEQEARSATLASIEQMMRQKDLAAVRKLREQKLEEEEQKQVRIAKARRKKMEGRMNMAKQREAAAAKYRETEDLRKHEIEKRNDDIHKVTLKLLEERRRVLDAEIAHKKVRAEKRAQYVMVLEDLLEKRRAAAKLKDEQWTTVEDVRWKRELERETRRTRSELNHWSEMQQSLAQENTRKRMANEEAVQAYYDAHRSKCKKKAVKKRQQKELDEKRAGHIEEKMLARAKRIKHEQWQKELMPKGKFGMSLISGQKDSKDETPEARDFKHGEARDARLKVRDEKLDAKQAQVTKQLQQSQKYRDQQEVEKLRVWKEAEHRRKAALEDSRISREEALEYAKEVGAQVKLEKAENWDRLEQVRDEKIRHKDVMRLQRVQEKYQMRPLGMAIPINV